MISRRSGIALSAEKMAVGRADQLLYLNTRLLDAARHLVAEGVQRRSIAVLLGKVGQHHLDHLVVDAGGGVVIEIDRFHGSGPHCM
jgi:hypothetical protein